MSKVKGKNSNRSTSCLAKATIIPCPRFVAYTLKHIIPQSPHGQMLAVVRSYLNGEARLVAFCNEQQAQLTPTLPEFPARHSRGVFPSSSLEIVSALAAVAHRRSYRVIMLVREAFELIQTSLVGVWPQTPEVANNVKGYHPRA